MDSHKRSTQLERHEIVETGRRGRWSDDYKLRIVAESFRAFKRRARYRRQQDAMAYHVRC
jgi:transposase-like protein